MTSCNGGAAVNSGYQVNADPVSTSTGTRYFATDNRGTIFFDNAATIASADSVDRGSDSVTS